MTHASTTGEEVMRSFVQHEHHDLAAGIDHIHETACEWIAAGRPDVGPDPEVSHWVEHVLKPHMLWEEKQYEVR